MNTERVIGAKIIKVKQRRRWSRLAGSAVYDVTEIVLDNGMKIVPWSVPSDGPPIVAMRNVRTSSKFGRKYLEECNMEGEV